MRRRPEWNEDTAMKSCSLGWVTRLGLSSGRKRDLAQDWRCPRAHFVSSHVSIPRLSARTRNCRCGHHLDVFGHHRAACARAGVLSRRGYALESVMARVCREAGGRVTTNVPVRDLDLEIADRADARRLEMAVDGLLLFGGAQLAIDATIVSALRGDGSARRGASVEDGVAQLREDGRNTGTQSWWVLAVGHDW